jgi:hypothetical protein
MNGLKLLQNPAKGGRAGGALLLGKHGVIGLGELDSELALAETVDQPGQGHDEGEGFDPLGLFNKDAAGEGEGVFEEANAALDVLQATTGLQICHNDVV